MTTLLDTFDRTAIASRLADVRERTRRLVSAVDWDTLRRQPIPILSPMVWDLGHIGNFEEIWLGQALGGCPPLRDRYQTMFDAVRNPRPSREGLPLPSSDELEAYWGHVRRQSLQVLDRVGLDPRLAGNGFVFEMVAEHEEQHQETLLQAMQVLELPPYPSPERVELPAGRPVDDEETVEIPGGVFRMGTDDPSFAYDNEREAHEVDLPTFRIDRFPVSNRRFLEFVDDGGYRRRELWSDAGWAWRADDDAIAPRHWSRDGDRWLARSMDRTEPVRLDQPVIHIAYFEADAFCRWSGRRLPTEAQWEKAARWNPSTGRTQRFPWGDESPTPTHANLDQRHFEPAPLGAYPGGASPTGVEQMIGDVWEWTASDFAPYPGFVAYPYDEYSKIFFGPDYRVLRGGSWATRPAVARATFRNWDYPIRRQIFSGFRCVDGGSA